MTDYRETVRAAIDRRDKARASLAKQAADLCADVLQRKLDELDAKFEGEVTEIADEAAKAEAALQAEIAKARHAVRLAQNAIPKTQLASFDTARVIVPTLSAFALVALYKNAIAAADEGFQIAIEVFKPAAFSDDQKQPAEQLAELVRSRQVARAARELSALAQAEQRLAEHGHEYRAALAPVLAERTKSNH